MSNTQNSHPRLLRASRVVLPHGIAENATLRISDGYIGEVGSDLHDDALSLDGLTLFPGFIDVHIHGAVGVDSLEASPSDLLKVSAFLATQGITAWLPTFVPAPTSQYQTAIRAIDEAMVHQSTADGNKSGARVLGVHYEGPFVSEAQCGALHREHFKTFSSAADIDALPIPAQGVAVKLTTVAPEIEGGIALVSELVSRGWIVSIGHTRADVPTLDAALAAGARHMTHFMNAMSPLHHRTPGPIGWGLLHDEVTFDFIADGIHLDPLVLQLLLRTKGAERVSLISDAIAAAGMGDGSYQIWDETIQVQSGRTRNAHGSIAGSVISMLDAVRMMRSVGASNEGLGRMAAANPAKLLGIKDRGSIETGKRADLVAIDDDGKVKLTIVGGEIVYSQL